jgi:SAM-dependent methyltransferase
MTEAKPINKCRACYSNKLIQIFSLGNQYITNFIDSEKEQDNIPKIPLDLVLCENCKLLQLKYNVPAEAIWGEQYWYKSGISSTIKADLRDIVKKSSELIRLNKGDIVADIGCNDGTMLEFYDKNKKLILIGFEPSKNVAKEAERKGFDVINDFFNAEEFIKKFGIKKAKLITAISMFYDLDEPNKFLRDIVSCLDKNGLFIIQQNYLGAMLEQNAFDNICHEHREYYSLTSLKNILEKHGLEIFDIEQNSINGGSIRTYIKFKDNESLKGFDGAEQRIRNLLEEEKHIGLDTLKPYQEFNSRISAIKERLVDFLRQEKEKGKDIWIYGASTRGNVALQYFGLGPDLITRIADMNPDKWGKKTVGSLIPVASPEKMRKARPDYLLVNTWHFFDEIKKQENEYYNRGGKFIVALPEFKIISKD